MEPVSEDRVMDAFMHGVARRDLREEFGRLQPKTTIELMKTANQWAEGEDYVYDTSPKKEVETSNWREARQKKKPRYTHDTIELVAAGYETPRDDKRDNSRQYDQGRQSSSSQYNRGSSSISHNDGGQKREWKRPLTPAEELMQPCKHHSFRNPETGKWGSSHLLKDCRKARKIYQAM